MSRAIKLHPNFEKNTLTVSFTVKTFVIENVRFTQLADNLRGQDVTWAHGWKFDQSGYLTNDGVSVYPEKPILFYMSSAERVRVLAKIEKETAQ